MITCDERLTFKELTNEEQERVKKFQKDTGYEPIEMIRDDSKIFPTLINGRQVNRKQWQEVVRIGARSCTGTFVGRNCVITAAHCGRHNATSTLEVVQNDGTLKNYRYRMLHHPRWKNQSNWDLAVLALEGEVDIRPAKVGVDFIFKKNLDVDLLGYGCTRIGGGGGNDGILRFGESKVVGLTSGTDVITSWRPSGGALCFGDSGGPMFADESHDSNKQRTLIAVNSKGNIRDTNYNMRLDLPDAKGWLEQIAHQYDLEIIGVNSAGENPSPDPAPPRNGGERDAMLATLAKLQRKLGAANFEIAEQLESQIGLSSDSGSSAPDPGDNGSSDNGKIFGI